MSNKKYVYLFTEAHGLGKELLGGKYNLLFRLLMEEFGQIGSQRLQNILQGGDTRRSQIPLHLGQKTLGQLAAGGKILQGQFLLQSQLF